MSVEYEEAEVMKHNTETDCWFIIGNENTGGPKVYDVTKYLSDHPGGPEIMLDLAGKDADEMFEDIGHSSEARKKMKEFLVGTLKVAPEKVKKVSASKATAADVKSSGGLNPLAVILLLIAIAIGVYFTQSK